MKGTSRTRRVLHVVGRMDRGGVETWLMHVLRHIDRDRFHLDFLTHTTAAGVFDDEIRRHGSRVLPCPDPRRPWSYGPSFRRIVWDYGPYDVVHSHVHHFSGLVLALARTSGIAHRIAHSHSDTAAPERVAGLARKGYSSFMRRCLDLNASVEMAVSQAAGVALFGAGWAGNPRRHVLPYGIDLQPFRAGRDPEARRELGVGPDALLLGHVGNFVPVKNHAFVLRVFSAVAERCRQARLLLVGRGPLEEPMRHAAQAAGLSDRVVFAGERGDVARLLRGAVDVFLFPSHYEGLPLAVIEAQAAGLPLVVSDTITPEVDIVPGLVKRLSLLQPPSAWADACLAAPERRHVPATALGRVADSVFNIDRCVRDLERVYEGLCEGQGAAA
jgi:glycosyltransferase involved in cell wall biosynthesis